jgi:high affinity sulfate transporter 1
MALPSPDQQVIPASRWTSCLPLLGVLRHYNPSWLRGDISAGVAVVCVAVPIGLAYSQLASLPPVVGLYATLLPMVIYALLGSSRQLVVGPDSATVALVGAVIIPLTDDPQQRIALAAMLSLMVGVLSIGAGVARLGFIADFLAKPVLVGYLNGVALTIMAGQMGKLLGYTAQGQGFFRLVYDLLSKIGQTHLPTLIVGSVALAVLFAMKRIAPKVPTPLVIVVGGIVASKLLGLEGMGIKVAGSVPAGLPPFAFPMVPTEHFGALATGALGVALMSFSSGVLTARSFASRGGYTVDANREFISLGLANIGAGLSQGFAISGADSRTAVADSAGGKTQLGQLFAAIGLALVLLFLTKPLAYLPTPALAAVLVVAVSGLLQIDTVRWLSKVSRPEFRLCLLTTLGVITMGMGPGVMVAVILSLIMILMRASRPPDAILGAIPGERGHVDLAENHEAAATPGLVIYRYDASLLFFNAPYFQSRLTEVISSHPDLRWLVVDMGAVTLLDTTGFDVLARIQQKLAAEGKTLAFARARGRTLKMMDRTGLVERVGEGRFFRTVDEAAAAFADSDRR